jgi:hypothetical protein
VLLEVRGDHHPDFLASTDDGATSDRAAENVEMIWK